MLQICMSDCVSKFGRLNKRALMKSWSLLLLSDSKLLELLSLFPGLSSSTLLLPYLLQPTKFTNLAHLGAPPSTPLDMLLDSIRSIRSPLVPYKSSEARWSYAPPLPWPLGHPWHVLRPPGQVFQLHLPIRRPKFNDGTSSQQILIRTAGCHFISHSRDFCKNGDIIWQFAKKRKRKTFQYDNSEECDLAWQIAKKDEVQFAYERCLVQ